MSAGSFSGDQIREFRRIYYEFSDPSEGGVLLEAFAPAVEACLHVVGLSLSPSSDYFDHEFRRLSTTGAVTWQKFFQVSAAGENCWHVARKIARACTLSVSTAPRSCALGVPLSAWGQCTVGFVGRPRPNWWVGHRYSSIITQNAGDTGRPCMEEHCVQQ